MAQLLSIFLDILTPVLILVLIGYLAGPLLGLEAQTLSRVAFYLLSPAFVFNGIRTASIQAQLAGQMVLYIHTVLVSCAIVGFLTARLLRRSRQMTAAYMLLASFANVGNFGLPIIQFKLGDAGLAAATIYFLASNAISFTIGVGVASWSQGGSLAAITAVFRTPALLAVVPALMLNWLQISLPPAIMRSADLLGSAMVPVLLVTLGVQLSEMGWPQLNGDVIIASIIRLVGGPALAILLAPAFHLPPLEQSAGVLQASMPAAVFASIIALEYNLVPDFVTTTVLFSTLASLITLTLLLALV